MEVEKGKKLLEIIITSTFVLLEFIKKNEEEEKGDMGQRLAQTKGAKGCIQQYY